jgi:hypothetical protein
MSSPSTESLRWSLAPSRSILWSLAVGKSQMTVLEELPEPVVELVEVEVEFIAQVRDRNLVDEVPLEDGNLFGVEEVTTLLAHGESPFGLC